MEQTKALNALEPFLALTKSATSPLAAADLITRATSAPQTFIFTELLSAPQIQALANSPAHTSSLQLLQIFSYGTYADYTSTSSKLPKLNPQQTQKLRQLSLLTLARNPQNLTYASLLKSLALETPRELEDLVISAIYAGLVAGTLDPYNQVVQLSSVAPLRDLQPNSIPSMLAMLNEWSNRCVSTLADLERQIAAVKTEAARRQRAEAEWAAHVEKLVEENGKEGTGPVLAKMGKALGMGAASKREADYDDGDMDLDEDEEEGERRGSKAKKRGIAW